MEEVSPRLDCVSYPESVEEDRSTDEEWKNVIFIPFNKKWEIFVVILTLINTYIIIYNIIFGDVHQFIFTFYTLNELVYTLDTLFTIMHRNMKMYNKKRKYVAKNLFFITLDVVTLLPVGSMYEFVHTTSGFEVNMLVRDLSLMQKLPRVYRVILYFTKLRNTVGSNQLFVVLLYITLRISLITMIIASIFFPIEGGFLFISMHTKSWDIIGFQANSELDFFLICLITMGNLILNNSHGLIGMQKGNEILIIIISITIGYLFKIMTFYGEITSVYIKTLTGHFEFTWKFHLIQNFMEDWEIEANVREKVLTYIHDSWKRQRGIRQLPDTIKLLPINLCKEITLDIAWDAFKHSHLFAPEEMAFKKTLSMFVEYKFYLPGDVIFKTGDMRYHMFYVNSGIIQILSDEDDESPILSLSNGTLIGETCVLMFHHARIVLKCATHCEILVLSLTNFYKTLLMYTGRSKHFRLAFLKRIGKAKIGLKIVERNLQMKKHTLDIPETTIKSLKRRWRLMSMLQSEMKRNAPMQTSDFGVMDGVHTSEFLNMLVLSDNVALKLKAVFLTKSFPFILDPDSDLAKCWQYIILICIVLMDFLLPIYICYGFRSIRLKVFLILLDIAYMLDAYILTSTAIKLKQQTISTVKQIFFKRFSQGSFIIDLYVALPIDYYLEYCTNVDQKVVFYYKLLKLLKTHKIMRYMRHVQQSNWNYPILVRLITYVFIVWFLINVTAAFHFSVMCNYYGFCDYKLVKDITHSIAEQILFVLFYIASLFLGKHSHTNIEGNLMLYITSYIISFMGGMILIYVFSEFCALFVLSGKHENEYNGEMNNLRNYLFALNIPRIIFRKLQDVLIFTWNFNKNLVMTGPNSTLRSTTRALRNELLRDRVISYLKRVPLFDGLPDLFYQELYLRTGVYVLPPGHDILTYEADIAYLRIISRGYCRMNSYVPIDRAYGRSRVLCPGDSFPILEIVHRVPSLIEVHTITACELLYIFISDIITFMKHDVINYEPYVRVVAEHKTVNERILMKMPIRLPQLKPITKPAPKGSYFTYDIIDETEDDLNTKMRSAFEQKTNEKLGKALKVIRLLMLRKTIHPESKGFVWFQAFVAMVILVRLSLSLMRYNLYGPFLKRLPIVSHAIDIFLHLSLILNLYVSLHVQFYNKKGLLITHHFYTVLNYLRTNFLPDVIATIPWRELQFARIFGDQNVQVMDMVITLMFRILQLYRIYGLLRYFQLESSKLLSVSITIARISLTIYLLTSFFTNAFLILTCRYDPKMMYCMCSEESWMSTMLDPKAYLSAYRSTVLSFYVVTMAATNAITGAYELIHATEIVTLFIVMITGIIIRIYFIALITSTGISGATKLNQFQQEISLFMKFVKDETVEEGLIQETISYYEYIFKKTKGRDFLTFTTNFHPTLRCEFTHSVFASTLKLVQMFHNMQSSFYRQISSKFNLIYFKKDTTVIRCNDVQNNLYIVHKGYVDIVVAKHKICTLKKGGVFGNFSNKRMRQTIFAYTKVHTELIVIDCKTFHRFIKSYPKLEGKIMHINELNCEFWESIQDDTEVADTFSDEESVVQVNSSFDSSNQSKGSNLFKSAAQKRIFHTRPPYQLWHEIFDFHIAAITSIIMTCFIFLTPESFELYSNIFKYSVDGVYLAKFYIGFNLTYTDPDSGYIVIDRKKIAIRYVRNLFWLDLLTIVPFDLVPILMGSSYNYRRLFSINRVFRIVYVLLYYEQRRYKLKGITLVRWSFLFYTIAFVLEALTCFWYVIWCWDNMCVIYTKSRDGREISLELSRHPFEASLMAFYHVLNLFTQTGLKSVKTNNYQELYATIIIIFVTQYLSAILTRTVTSHLVIKCSKLSIYECSMQNLKDYLKCRELSPAILNRAWNYLLNLWTYRNGESFPIIIRSAPTYLKQDIMNAMYGNHLRNHYLFSKTHIDFLRQLVCHLKPLIYFPNDCIVEKNDVDSTMYFIHSGEVAAYDVMGKNEHIVKILTKSMTFGEAQGLYNVPHSFTYKAQTVCNILLLRKCDWEYMIEWFPASMEQICKSAEENLIKGPQPYRAHNFVYDIN